MVLGGGLAGLSCAEKLLDAGFAVTILEKDNHLGGLAASFEVEGEWIPKFYHHIVRSNKYTIAALTRFGVMTGAKWQRVRMSLGVNGKLYELRKLWEFFRMPGSSVWAKLRFAAFGAYTILKPTVPKISAQENAQDWLYKYCGKEATDYFWWNLYGRNKFNIPLSQISASQFSQRLWEKEGYDYFTFPPKGLQPMIEGFSREIQKKGGVIVLSARLSALDLAAKTLIYNGKKDTFDILVNTIPVPELIKFSHGFPDEYVTSIRKLRYCPAVGLCFATEDWLKEGVYWINLFGERVQVVMQHSVLCDKYKGKVTWCIRYGGSEEDIGLSDEQIIREYTACLKKYFPNAKFLWIKVFKEKYAEPVYDKDYVSYAPSYRTPLAWIYHAGIQVTFPKIRNQNVALESGYKVAEMIVQDAHECTNNP